MFIWCLLVTKGYLYVLHRIFNIQLFLFWLVSDIIIICNYHVKYGSRNFLRYPNILCHHLSKVVWSFILMSPASDSKYSPVGDLDEEWKIHRWKRNPQNHTRTHTKKTKPNTRTNTQKTPNQKPLPQQSFCSVRKKRKRHQRSFL